jgi:LysR family hydrogen peroxide-inducible transcriptional activator
MVSAGYGITLLPEMCLGIEERGRKLTLVRFVEPEPFRTIGLVWRSTSPRKRDFQELGRLVLKAWNEGPAASPGLAGRHKKMLSAAPS